MFLLIPFQLSQQIRNAAHLQGEQQLRPAWLSKNALPPKRFEPSRTIATFMTEEMAVSFWKRC